ncbi:MAG: ubiquinol-cytochrome C chaperone [Alphaproteobacteria bacterium]|nr:ubiquinol-cytochrome C chaperone [Alphaproteobacteria bacterium]
MFHLINRILAPRKYHADILYSSIVAQARKQKIFSDWGVPDTPDGRFDSLVLHMVMVLYRLSHCDDSDVHRQFGKELIEVMIEDLDHNFRELGVGDLAVGKRIKGMLKAFYGRMENYGQAFESQDEALLEQVVVRNIYRKSEKMPSEAQIKQLCAYIWQQTQHLQHYSGAQIRQDDFIWGELNLHGDNGGV